MVPIDVLAAALPGARSPARREPAPRQSLPRGPHRHPVAGSDVRSTAAPTTAHGLPPTDSEDEVIATLRDVAAASARAHAAMSRAEQGILEGVRRLEAGAEVRETLGGSQVHAHRGDPDGRHPLAGSTRS